MSFFFFLEYKYHWSLSCHHFFFHKRDYHLCVVAHPESTKQPTILPDTIDKVKMRPLKIVENSFRPDHQMAASKEEWKTLSCIFDSRVDIRIQTKTMLNRIEQNGGPIEWLCNIAVRLSACAECEMKWYILDPFHCHQSSFIHNCINLKCSPISSSSPFCEFGQSSDLH